MPLARLRLHRPTSCLPSDPTMSCLPFDPTCSAADLHMPILPSDSVLLCISPDKSPASAFYASAPTTYELKSLKQFATSGTKSSSAVPSIYVVVIRLALLWPVVGGWPIFADSSTWACDETIQVPEARGTARSQAAATSRCHPTRRHPPAAVQKSVQEPKLFVSPLLPFLFCRRLSYK